MVKKDPKHGDPIKSCSMKSKNGHKEKELVSVIIPTFNRAAVLVDAVNSVLEQKYDNIEILIVDDGSTDHTESTVNSLRKHNPNIFYLKNFRAKGPSGARNSGILKAKGDYLTFLDSDDTWLNWHLDEGVRFLEENTDVDVLFGNFHVFDSHTGNRLYDFFEQKTILLKLGGERRTSNVVVLKGNLFNALIQENFFHLGSAILRKDKTRPVLFDESICLAEDRDFAIRLHKERIATFAYRKEPVFRHNRHDTSLLGTQGSDGEHLMLKSHIYLFRKYIKNYQLGPSEQQIVEAMLSKRLMSLSYGYRKQAKFLQAAEAALESCKYGLSWGKGKEILKIMISPLYGHLHKRDGNSVS
jgi:glycosyltransferase involved in cell wall biosynthesis